MPTCLLHLKVGLAGRRKSSIPAVDQPNSSPLLSSQLLHISFYLPFHTVDPNSFKKAGVFNPPSRPKSTHLCSVAITLPLPWFTLQAFPMTTKSMPPWSRAWKMSSSRNLPTMKSPPRSMAPSLPQKIYPNMRCPSRKCPRRLLTA